MAAEAEVRRIEARYSLLPVPEVSIESNRPDIFCCGGPEELAPETACMPDTAPTPVMSICKSLPCRGVETESNGCDKTAARGKQFVYHDLDQ